MSKAASQLQRKPRRGQPQSGAERRTEQTTNTAPGGADFARLAVWQKDELKHRAKAAEVFRRM